MGYFPYPPKKTYPEQLIGPADVDVLVDLIKQIEVGAAVAIDTETTGLFPHETDEIRGMSLAFRLDDRSPKIHAFYIPVSHPDSANLPAFSLNRIFTALTEREPFLVLHHGKFDFDFLRQLPAAPHGGVHFPFPGPGNWWDTKIVAWLLDENLPSGLKEQAAFHFGEDSRDEQKAIRKIVAKVGWGGVTAAQIAPYGAKDAELTLRLYELQLGLIGGRAPVLGAVGVAIPRELAVQGVLFRMQRTGILVDEGLIEMMTTDTEKRIAEIEEQFSINLKSPLQVGRLLDEMGCLPDGHPRTPTGQPSMSRAALESLEATPEDQQVVGGNNALGLILEHRRLQKALSGYLVPLKARIGRDGRIHPGFSSTGTVTGRFSCSNPNLQTIPRADTLPGVRDIFIAEDGFELWEYDLQAAEMRVMAGMAGQQNMIEMLESGADIHGSLAADVFGPKYTGLQRRYAKNIGYGWNYGLTSLKTAAKYIKATNAESIADKILTGLKKKYPDIVRLMNRTTRQAQKDGYVPIHPGGRWPGRFRRFVTQGGRRPAPYTALNAQIQGGIGEFMKDVMLAAEEPLALYGARLCLQVHDSLVVEVPEGSGPRVLDALQSIADSLQPFAMPMIFDGKPWGEHE